MKSGHTIFLPGNTSKQGRFEAPSATRLIAVDVAPCFLKSEAPLGRNRSVGAFAAKYYTEQQSAVLTSRS
jgi:hypothetical protein